MGRVGAVGIVWRVCISFFLHVLRLGVWCRFAYALRTARVCFEHDEALVLSGHGRLVGQADGRDVPLDVGLGLVGGAAGSDHVPGP